MSLSNGLPKQLATAICGERCVAVAVSATRSPTLLPMAMTVSPKIDVDTPSIRPSASMTATSSDATRSSHVIVHAKAARTTRT